MHRGMPEWLFYTIVRFLVADLEYFVGSHVKNPRWQPSNSILMHIIRFLIPENLILDTKIIFLCVLELKI